MARFKMFISLAAGISKSSRNQVMVEQGRRYGGRLQVVSLLLLFLTGVAVAEDRIEFNRDIRPILSDNCFYCHGFDAKNRKADLRLDTFEGATRDLGGYFAVVPKRVSESELVARILSEDPDELMPPPDSEKQLTVEEKELIKRWIEQGAEYQEHWAWQVLKRPEVPGGLVGAAAIDALIEQGWKEHRVEPVGEASPRELLRRLSFDLRGVAPSMAEVVEFEKQPGEEAFLNLRDQWMSELSYAEHQAVRWLDLVRWADTSGFVSDEPIASGAYRAWIIEAFAKNMPFDQFSIAQLAGDLLPYPTDGELVASGYNRIVNTNCEAGAIEDEQLYKLKGEHVRALGTVWLGLTTGCSECHDHKFDPILAKDYYSLAAFFDDLVEAGVYTPGDRREPLHYVHGEEAKSVRDGELKREIGVVMEGLAAMDLDQLAAWEAATVAALAETTSRRDYVWIPSQLPWARVIEGTFIVGERDGRQVRETVVETGQFDRHHAAELMTGYLMTENLKSNAKLDAWFVDVWVDAENRPEMLGFQISQGDYGRLGWRTANYETYFWGEDGSGELAKEQTWSDPKRVKRMGDLPKEAGWVRLKVPFDQFIKPVGGQAFRSVGMAWLQSGGRVQWGDSGVEARADKVLAQELGETAIRKLWETPLNRQVYQTRLEAVARVVKKSAINRDEFEQGLVEQAFRESSQDELMEQLRRLESEMGMLRADAMPVLVSRQAAERKTTRLVNRGDFRDTAGPMVEPAVPEFLGELPDVGRLATRLDLARWMFSDENPLTARVYVNRLWQQYFGRGISETLEDSGTQGDWPSHLALLDWLAVEFKESGWDRDHLVRLLTATKTYRLSSKPTADMLQRDLGNRWHTRQSRFRLNAEVIRDAALRAAGLLRLTEQVPVESFFPYQPGVYWDSSNKVMYGSRHMAWDTSEADAQYGRSVYTFWKRQNIHPTMLAFDAPTRQECTAERNVTNTPGQALALLNDPIFVEAARVLASRVLSEAGETDEARICYGMELVLQRRPSGEELEVLAELLGAQRVIYQANVDDAAKLVGIGQSQAGAGYPAAELAAWTAVSRALLNLHEFLNRS